MFIFEFEIKRVRFSVTQGEVEVYCNGVLIERYGDQIAMNGTHDKMGGFGSKVPDKDYIKAVMRDYPNKIIKTMRKTTKKL